MRTRRVLALVSGAICALGLSACDSADELKQDQTPIVGVLELPISHRAGDSDPGDAARIEIAPGEIRVNGETALTLENGKVPAAEQSGHTLPKLKDKLVGKSSLAISTHAATPYATLARVMNTGLEAGARTFAFKVRKTSSNTETGWLVVSNNQFTASPEESKFALEQLLPWSSFTSVWDDTITACQATERADCGYRPVKKAEGGQLDMMLRVRGSGLAIRMRQTGAPEAVAQAPTKKPAVEMLDGIKAPPSKAEQELEEPSTEHVFTLRGDQATMVPSPISGIVKPVCSGVSCPVVLDAEGISMSGRVISLIGAAFPDGTPQPKISWVLPP